MGKWDNLASLLLEIDPELKDQRYFCRLPGGKIASYQRGIVRSNCMDNSDRTNVVQSIFARRVLLARLASHSKLKPDSIRFPAETELFDESSDDDEEENGKVVEIKNNTKPKSSYTYFFSVEEQPRTEYNKYYNSDYGHTYAPLYEYYKPPSVLNGGSGYKSSKYGVTYYDGYGYNTYYQGYGYYRHSIHPEDPLADEGGFPVWLVIVIIFICGAGAFYKYKTQKPQEQP